MVKKEQRKQNAGKIISKIISEKNRGYAKYRSQGDTIRITELNIDPQLRGSKEGYEFIELFAEQIKD